MNTEKRVINLADIESFTRNPDWNFLCIASKLGLKASVALTRKGINVVFQNGYLTIQRIQCTAQADLNTVISVLTDVFSEDLKSIIIFLESDAADQAGTHA